MNLEDYYRHFGVEESLIGDIFSIALSKGGDYCDLYFQHTLSDHIGLEDNIVNRAYRQVDFGVGIRVLKGDQTGYSFSEEITRETMETAARMAANIADSSRPVKALPLKLHKSADYYPITRPWEEVTIDEKIPVLHRINDRVFSLDPRVIKSAVQFTNETSYVLLATSEGRITCDCLPMGAISVSCTAEKNGRREQNRYATAGRRGFDFFSAKVDDLAREVVERTILLFDAEKPPGGEMPVVLASGSSGILLHEAIGHGMEADFNRKKVSIFCDKIGKPVAERFVNIVDDGTNGHMRGSLNVDDEGNDSRKTVLVENGILKGYLHDRLSSRYYKVEPTGNGRRQSFRFAPEPRMRNTYMLPGPFSRDEVIKSVKKGLYAQSFTNGQVLIGAGDFTFYVKMGYLIEDGRLTRPVKDINIIGNGPKVLSDIVMVADDFKMDERTWTCGKDGQSVPVSLGQPTVKVSKITVGGM